MDRSRQSLHGLPILNYDVVNENTKRKDIKSISGNNIYTDIVKNIKKKEAQKEKADANKSKTKRRRKSTSQNNLKKTFSVYNSYIKRLIQPRSITNSSRNKNNKKSPNRQSNQIEVLFSSESRKLKNKRSRINQDLINDIYHSNAINYDTVQDVYTSKVDLKNGQNLPSCVVPRQERKQFQRQNAINTANCSNTCKANPTTHSCDISTQFKVIQFPDYDQTDTELEAINMERNDELNNFQCHCYNMYDSHKVNQADPSMPCVPSAQRGGGDACTVSVQCLDAKKNHIKHEKSNNDGFECFLDPFIIHENALHLAKNTLKYLIFGLALIVWSPCIITLYFCWLVTYPLRPSYTMTNVPRNSKCKRKSQIEVYRRNSKYVTDNTVQTCRDNTWSILLRGISWAYQPLAVSFGAFRSLLNPNPNDFRCHPSLNDEGCSKKDKIMTSDPGKKYMLYYSRSKGWVMKTSKRHSKKNKNNKCYLNEVSKVTYGPHCDKQFDNRNNIESRSRYPQRSCQVPMGKKTIEKYNKKCLQKSRSRHKHLCTDTSGLPVHVKLLNPMFNNNLSSKHRNVRPIDKKPKSIIRKRKRECVSEEEMYLKRNNKKCSQHKPKCLNPKKRLKLKTKVWRYCKELKNNIISIVDEVETEVFGDNSFCNGIYIHTLRRTPWYFVYKNCPSFYPVFLGIYKFYENTCHFFLLFISACIWCPLLAFFYLCYTIFCRSI